MYIFIILYYFICCISLFMYAVYDFSSEYRNYRERPQNWNDHGTLNKFVILVCNYGNSWFIVELSVGQILRSTGRICSL